MNYYPFGAGCKSLKLRATLISFYKYEALIYVLYVWGGHNFINLGATKGHNPDLAISEGLHPAAGETL